MSFYRQHACSGKVNGNCLFVLAIPHVDLPVYFHQCTHACKQVIQMFCVHLFVYLFHNFVTSQNNIDFSLDLKHQQHSTKTAEAAFIWWLFSKEISYLFLGPAANMYHIRFCNLNECMRHTLAASLRLSERVLHFKSSLCVQIPQANFERHS